MHPRPSPIAASLYTLRDLNVDVIILHGPHGCCFRTGRLLENDGVRVVTTAMSENDFIFGASSKLEEVLLKVDSMFDPRLVGVVGTCASMIIGEDLKEAVQNAGIKAKVISVESHGGFGEGDNTEGAIAVLKAAAKEGIISSEESLRQSKMLKLATEIEKTRGMAKGEYIAPSFGDDKEKIAQILIGKFKNNEKIVFVLNSKKETSYLFADLLKIPFIQVYSENKPIIIANLNEEIGLPRIKQHARNIKSELHDRGIKIDFITGGLDEYPITGERAAEIINEIGADMVVVSGVPHAVPIDKINAETLAITDGPRLVEPLKEMGYKYVVTELDAHSKTLGTDKIVESDFGMVLRKKINTN